MTASTPDVALRGLARAPRLVRPRKAFVAPPPADSGDRIFVTLLSLNFMLLAFFVVLGTASTFDEPRVLSVARSMHETFDTRTKVVNSASAIRLTARQALQAGVSDAFAEVLPLAKRVTGDNGDRVDVVLPSEALTMSDRTRDSLLDAIATLMRLAPAGVHYQLVIDGGDDAVTMATDLLARGVPATQLMTGSDADAERVSFSFLLLEGDDEALFTRLMPADQTASQAVTSQTVTSQTGAVAP